MIWKIVTVLSFALFVQGQKEAISEQRVVIHHQKSGHIGSPAYNAPNKSGDEEKSERSYTSYEFSYKVNDPETHDIKGQHEKGSEDEVVGNYWLIEPNGRKRTVNYQANDDKGFNAQVDYTESLKEKKTDDDIEISQNREQGNVNKNNDEDNKNNADDANQNPLDSSNPDEPTQMISDLSPLEENNLDDQTKLDNQVDEANYISNIEGDNVDRTDRENLAQGNHNTHVTSNLVNNKRENNGRNLSKSRRGNPEKAKREKIKRNKNQNRSPSRNENESNRDNRDGQRNGKHIKQENIKLNENNNRIVNKRLKTNRNRNKNFNNPENNGNSGIDGIENKINSNLEQNHRIQNGIKKEENNYNNPQNVLGIDNYFVLPNLEPSKSVIQKEKQSDTVTETYAHSIRIYHPKNISPTPKEQLKY